MSVSKIPIQNIYYLLAYAWDHFHGGEECDIDPTQCPDIHNLLAMLLGNGVRRLATRGIDKHYHAVRETTAKLRGRVEVLESHRRMTHVSGRMICEFDELTANTLPNRILKSTCERLLASGSQLTVENRQLIRYSLRLLHDVEPVRIESRLFRRFQLHRNNRHYRLLMHVCRLLHDVHLPSEQAGGRRFKNILEDETVMHQLFENFVRQFAVRHCRDAKVSAMQIVWDGEWEEEVGAVLPIMETDVTLNRPDRKTILDCKYYKHALVSRNDRYRLHSSHLYQLTAYLQNKSRDQGWATVEGILLYPAVNHQLDLDFELLGHRIGIKSIDLDRPWSDIHNGLLRLLS
ncbi:5-methylcytosine restriction system specificity protein McrC [Botrimarina mediterranea]|uniref:5-methylcytosine-specific restriction enzyme subunit McrC n=1 Tax=Botrimarina mediterranea TaxID=2528022 RepID=A0A518K7U6_9BACT|nr:hypothetical protein [Botrimarina mediterranea]QDV73855.1 5-methylcytosine-specific restriction enzyme subunit McrC [Botrimarina mediterranea]QDV78485.1 5-methylcytosine-specific restriction enzyme subunit McrC [Planctomycetes bacterium K2D]